MRKNICVIIVVLLGSFTINAQVAPQFSFNAKNDYSILTGKNGDCDEYLNSLILLFLTPEMNNNKLKLYHRLYEIEHTSVICYRTVDKALLNFHTTVDTLFQGIPVYFGAVLENNRKSGKEMELWFHSPVKRIDPTIFAPNVSYIKLPASKGLEYSPSRTSCVTNLAVIEGRDVVDGHALVDSKGTLIVAAVAGLSSYTIPTQVRVVGDGAFRGCKLKKVVIPENVVSIGMSAFELCDSLECVTILSDVPIEIKESAFRTDKEAEYVIYVPEVCYKTYRKMYPELKKKFKKIKD